MNSGPEIKAGKKRLLWATTMSVIMFAAVSSCHKSVTVTPDAQGWLPWQMASGNTSTGLGPSDYNAGYSGFFAPVKPGERLIARGQFPHCRYMSFMVFDQNFMAIDALPDFKIVPAAGVNPFVPGVERSATWLGEFEVQVLMEKAPAGPRPPNTLYAGVAHDGRPNKVMVLAYRVYLPDQGLGFRDHHPLAVSGGVPPVKLKLLNSAGEAYCPSELWRRVTAPRVLLSVLLANADKLLNPVSYLGKAGSPPIWLNNASRETQRENTYVGNDDTGYIATAINQKFGELLVLRWKPSRTPEETYLGKPFSADVDMRYFSLTFAYTDRKRFREGGVLTEKTLADFEIPTLPDGTRQLVIGFGGIPRPATVPTEQWVSLKHTEGIIIMRNILITPGYPGDFLNLAPGEIPLEFDQYTPGGVYCSAAEFAQNPDLALTRVEILKTRSSP